MSASSAGQTRGKAEGNLPAHARAAASGGEVSQAHGVRAGERETQAHGLHEQERRLHRPAGAGAGEVTAHARRGPCPHPAPFPPGVRVPSSDSGDVCVGPNS